MLHPNPSSTIIFSINFLYEYRRQQGDDRTEGGRQEVGFQDAWVDIQRQLLIQETHFHSLHQQSDRPLKKLFHNDLQACEFIRAYNTIKQKIIMYKNKNKNKAIQ